MYKLTQVVENFTNVQPSELTDIKIADDLYEDMDIFPTAKKLCKLKQMPINYITLNDMRVWVRSLSDEKFSVERDMSAMYTQRSSLHWTAESIEVDNSNLKKLKDVEVFKNPISHRLVHTAPSSQIHEFYQDFKREFLANQTIFN